MTVIPTNPHPLWRANATGETSSAAAAHMKPRVQTLRQRVLDLLEVEPATPEMLHAKLREQGVNTVLNGVRPRCTELAQMGLIVDSGRRALAESGRCKAIVWQATTPEQRSQFAARRAAQSEKGPDHG